MGQFALWARIVLDTYKPEGLVFKTMIIMLGTGIKNKSDYYAFKNIQLFNWNTQDLFQSDS